MRANTKLTASPEIARSLTRSIGYPRAPHTWTSRLSGAFVNVGIKLLATLNLQGNRAECRRALAAVCDVFRSGNSTIVDAVLWSISATMAHDRAQHYFSEEIPELTAGLSGEQIDIHRAVQRYLRGNDTDLAEVFYKIIHRDLVSETYDVDRVCNSVSQSNAVRVHEHFPPRDNCTIASRASECCHDTDM